MRVTVVDVGLGNVGSIVNMLQRLYATPVLASTPDTLRGADKIILPGVGHFDSEMKRLHENGLVEVLHESVCQNKTPVLGICLGFQIMTRGSEEGSLPGLGWFPTTVQRFNASAAVQPIRVPHMGWNTVKTQGRAGLFDGLVDPRFYFVHSYHVASLPQDQVTATTHYGYDFICAASSGNIHGVQFHPEKSHRFGMGLLKNFLEKT